MIRHRWSPPQALRQGVGLLAAAQLAACASAGQKPAAPAAATPPAPAAPQIVTMAPIPNPPAQAPRERERERHVSHAHASSARREHAAEPAAPTPSAGGAVAKPANDPTLARQLRGRGLEALNRGSVGKAIDLLSRAAQLDPENALIRRDLERAQRIARAVHGPH